MSSFLIKSFLTVILIFYFSPSEPNSANNRFLNAMIYYSFQNLINSVPLFRAEVSETEKESVPRALWTPNDFDFFDDVTKAHNILRFRWKLN